MMRRRALEGRLRPARDVEGLTLDSPAGPEQISPAGSVAERCRVFATCKSCQNPLGSSMLKRNLGSGTGPVNPTSSQVSSRVDAWETFGHFGSTS